MPTQGEDKYFLEILSKPDWVLHLQPTIPARWPVEITTMVDEEHSSFIFPSADSSLSDQEEDDSTMLGLQRLKKRIENARIDTGEAVGIRHTNDVDLQLGGLEEFILDPLMASRHDFLPKAGEVDSYGSGEDATKASLESDLELLRPHFNPRSFRQWSTRLDLTLHYLTLKGTGLGSDSLLPLAKFLDGNISLKWLCLSNNEILTDVEHAKIFAQSLKRSVLQGLRLEECSSRQSPSISPVETFLMHLDSTNLKYLLIGWDEILRGRASIPVNSQADSIRLCVAISGLLRRSIVGPTHPSGSVRSEAEGFRLPFARNGCPNLLHFRTNYGETLSMAHVIMAAKLGPLEQYYETGSTWGEQAGLGSSGDRLTPNLTTDVFFRGIRWRQDSPLQVEDGTWEEIARHPQIRATSSSGNTADEEFFDLEPSDRKAAMAMKDAFEYYQEHRIDVSEPIFPNHQLLLKIHRAAFRILAAARTSGLNVTCRTSPNQESPGWLRLPAEIRTACLTELDEDGVLTLHQVHLILSFAADRRTIGYGRGHEGVLLRVRLHRESVKGRASSGTSILAVKEWPFREALQRAVPYDWHEEEDLEASQEAERNQKAFQSSESAAFLAVTDCMSIRRPPPYGTRVSELFLPLW